MSVPLEASSACRFDRAYSAGVANPVDCPVISGFGVRAVFRILVLTKRVS
jgi:hypothetical protein